MTNLHSLLKLGVSIELHSKQNPMVLTLIRTLICTPFRNTFITYTNPKRSVKWTLSVLFRPYVFKLISVQSVQSKCWKCSFKCVQSVQDKCCKRSFKSRVLCVWISVDFQPSKNSNVWMAFSASTQPYFVCFQLLGSATYNQLIHSHSPITLIKHT